MTVLTYNIKFKKRYTCMLIAVGRNLYTYLYMELWAIYFAGSRWHICCMLDPSLHLCMDTVLLSGYMFSLMLRQDDNHMLK